MITECAGKQTAAGFVAGRLGRSGCRVPVDGDFGVLKSVGKYSGHNSQTLMADSRG
jgi:hypothetical protein